MVGLWGIKYGKETAQDISVVKKSGRKGYGKGRSLTTYQNKLRKIERYYNRMVSESKKAKKNKRGNKNHVYFFEKYSTFKQYEKVLTIKKASS